MADPAAVAREIAALVRHSSPPPGVRARIVAIDGAGGAGKSTLAARVAEELGGAPIVPTDDFAGWKNPLDWWPALLEQALAPLAAGRTARYVPSSWSGERREPVVVEPADYVVLEGVSASRHAFRRYLCCSVWVETPRDVRLARGLERDGEDARARWEQWMAEEDEYVERERPREHADLVVPGDGDSGATGSAAADASEHFRPR